MARWMHRGAQAPLAESVDSFPSLARGLFESGRFGYQAIVGKAPWSDWYPESYKDAADRLVEDVVKESDSTLASYLGPPILFLYRHHLELVLKSHLEWRSLEIKKEHSLSVLWNRLRTFLESEYEHNDALLEEHKQVFFEPIERLIGDFDKMDPDSTAFRYASRLDGTPYFLESTVDVVHLRNQMDRLSTVLGF